MDSRSPSDSKSFRIGCWINSEVAHGSMKDYDHYIVKVLIRKYAELDNRACEKIKRLGQEYTELYE